MPPDLTFCPKCKWFRERIIGLSTAYPWCEHPAYLNSTTGMAYPVKYDLPACGNFDAIEATSPIQSCFLCGWYASDADLFCTKPNHANKQDILKSHINKQTGCSQFKSAAFKANCGQCFWYDPTKEFCAGHAVHQIEFFITDTGVCDHFFEPVDPEHTCDECEYFHVMLSSKAVCKNKKISKIYKKEDLAGHLACKKHFKIKEPKRTCGQCHWIRSENDKHHTCVSHEDIEHLVDPDMDATECPSFAPIVKAKNGSVCYSCPWVLSSKEHCIYRTEPGADFPKGDKCAFHALQPMNPKEVKNLENVKVVEVGLGFNAITKPEWIKPENLIPASMVEKVGCGTCNHWSGGYCKSSVQHKIKSKGTSAVSCIEYTKKEPNTSQTLKMKLKPEFTILLKNFQKMQDKKAPEAPLEQLLEHTCKECEHFGVLTNGKSICGTEETSQLYTEADQTACEKYFKPKPPSKLCKTAKPGQRKIKWK